MRLKKIEILGFKSFADKVALEFDAGITGIVGPNGCGKSNISDAFRWVLGEQSAKSMRGNKMPDVIFAGTNNRKPLNFAEVTITLTDIAGELPVEYEEVAVTRRLHRNGDSDYFINRHPVRLKDVQELFLDSGMGKNAFSIFEQGKIDQVINFSPLERRYIFEEAAGILRFLQRKREALRKLEQVDGNMNRVKDIHQEVEKQIILLEEQAEKARVYKENKARLEALEKGIFLAKWDNYQTKGQETSKKDEGQRQVIEEANQQLVVLQGKLQEAKNELAQAEKALRVRSEEVYKTRSDKEIKSREKQAAQERLKEILAKEKRWQNELESMMEKRKLRQIECQNTKKQQKESEQELARQEKILRGQRDKANALENEVGKMRAEHQKAQQELLKLLQNENQIESELKQNTVRLENTQERKEQLAEKKEKLSTTVKELTQNVKERKSLVQEVSEEIDKQKSDLQKFDHRIQDLAEEIGKHQTALEQTSQEMTENKARQKALLRLREEMEGFSAGSKRLLQESTNSKSPLHNKLKGLYEFITPSGGAEAPLAAVMRPYAQTLVVNTKKDFQEAVAFARTHKLKDFSLVCIEGLPNQESKKAPKGIAPLISQVAVSALASHFLEGSYIAETAEEAIQAVKKTPGIEVWSEEGAFIDRHGVAFYATQGENNAFMREAELKALEKKLKEGEAAKQTLEEVLKTLNEKKKGLQNERTELDKAMRRSEMKMVEVNFALQRANGDLEKASAEAKQADGEIEALAAAATKLTALLKELTQKHVEAKAKASQIQKDCAGLHAELEKLTASLKLEQRDLQEKDSAYQKISDENRKMLHALNVIEVKDIESQQQEKRLEEEIQAGKEQQSQIKVKGEEFETLLAGVEEALSQVTAACAEMEKEVAKKKSAIEKIDGQINQERAQLKKLEGDLYQMGIQAAQIESSRQSLEGELQERYHLTIEEARALGVALDRPLDQAERQMRALRHDMDAAGDINMTSIEEFDKNKNRYEFLNQQIDDLNVSKGELVQIITQLDVESRKIFKETFDQISANFKKNFKILFNGGEADLQFTETGDVLEAGIEIIAKPPGKQMRSISLLSGGEKCLTAMALLFAIFEVKPAPFCILDEIDAPLDDSNVERFVNVVKQFIDRCQFIIITHNKRTMAIADVLFGVSMEERGVSKLLSIEFTRDVAPEPALV